MNNARHFGFSQYDEIAGPCAACQASGFACASPLACRIAERDTGPSSRVWLVVAVLIVMALAAVVFGS